MMLGGSGFAASDNNQPCLAFRRRPYRCGRKITTKRRPETNISLNDHCLALA